MTTSSRSTRVLRIGILRHGNILQERLIPSGDSVSVGESSSNTFVLPPTPLLAPKHQLFEATPQGYRLRLTEGMKGKLSAGGAVVSLDALAREPSATRENGVVCVPLTQQDRGKIVIDGVSILFQFIEPPPVCVATPLQQMDFRPRLMEEDDPVFLGFLGLWSALASILVIWVWSAEPEPYEITDLPDRIAKLTLPPKVVVPDVEPEVDEQAPPIEVVRDRVPVDRIDEPPAPPADAPRDEQQLRDHVLENSTLLAELIVTRGDSPTRAAAMWSDEEKGLADLDDALANAGGITTDASQAGPRRGTGGTDRAADIDDLVSTGGGDARSIEGPAVQIASVRSEPGQVEVHDGDSSEVEETIRHNAGSLNYCYERRLKARPDLHGRVEVSWVVEDGEVVGTPLVVLNTTDDPQLATCVQRQIRRWTFAGFTGEASNPFIFQPK